MRVGIKRDQKKIWGAPPLPISATRSRAIVRMPPRGALALALASWARQNGPRGLLHVTREEASLQELADMARGFVTDLDVLVLPPWDCLPYDRARPSHVVTGMRVASLARLAMRSRPPVLVLTTVSAMLQRVPPRARLLERGVALRTGMAMDPDWLRTTLEAFGYAFDERVDEPGEAAIRGSAIDVFLTGRAEPVRLDMEGGTIATMRSFDPIDQRGREVIETVFLLPATEAFTLPGEAVPGVKERLLPEGPLETLFDYVPDAILSLAPDTEERIADWLELVRDGYEARRLGRRGAGDTEPIAPPDRHYLAADEIASILSRPHVLAFATAGEELAEPLPGEPAATLERLAALARARAEANDKVVVCVAELNDRWSRRFARLLGAEPRALKNWSAAETLGPGEIGLVGMKLIEGFRLNGLSVLGDALACGPRAPGDDGAGAVPSIQDLRIGDLVVEPAHGLARLSGLTMVEEEAAARECLSLEFADSKRLLVPAMQAGRIWRYGSGGASVNPDSLTGEAWLKRRREVESGITEAAAGIVAQARAREAAKAPAITPPRSAFERFVRRVPYTLTADQDKAIGAILRDLASGRPMNRLVCGDVGFGKTEIALHAAAAVALAGQQVAMMAPTTLLARQHLGTFHRRFAGLGIAIEELSRSTRSAAGKAVIRGLSQGAVRVVIGTHALTAPGLRFQDLGLVIIDEEQRFGEGQKRRLRGLGTGRHVLTMTATPLPRSLQAALVGLVDISALTMPPLPRQPVRGFVLPFDSVTVRGALLREARRGGQSFVICPRIEDLSPMRTRLVQATPELSLAVAHGRMPPDAIDAVMLDFADGRTDVLLATNIVEAGLDIPNANTMLVWRPDRFGLAQLHQLRGRVGRGRRRATAYLLTDPDQPLTGAARKRLTMLATLDRPGAGFAISSADLDLRGAGDLLGEAQAGHARLVGTELYRHLLTRALAAARGEGMPEEWAPEITLEASAYIPRDLVPQADVRLEIYRRLGRLQLIEQIDELAEEVEDRFGDLPQPAKSLLDMARLAALCRSLGIASLRAGPKAVATTSHDQSGAQALEELLAASIGARRRGDRVILPIAEARPEARLSRVCAILRKAEITIARRSDRDGRRTSGDFT